MSGHDLMVVGAGAAGLWFSAVAGELGHRVLLLEKTPRAGTKVLASGGTHCNLTTTLSGPAAARLFGPRGERFLRPAFEALPPEDVRRQFHELGLPTVEAPLEKIYPASGRAKDVRDVLLHRALRAGVELRTDWPVRSIAQDGTRWVCQGERGSAEASGLVLAVGGKSYPRTGTTGDAYPWLDSLDLRVVPTSPALVPLLSPEAWVRELTGIAWPSGELQLLGPKGQRLEKRRRPILFTHTGLSGPAAMDVSGPVGAQPEETFHAKLDLLPGGQRDRTRQALHRAIPRHPLHRLGLALEEELSDPLPRRFVESLLHLADVPPEKRRIGELSRAERHALVEVLHGVPLVVRGTRGFDHAEVTRGGLDLREVDPWSMRVNRHEGLWVLGELLDLDGPIGGLNFQAAFAEAELAARTLGPA